MATSFKIEIARALHDFTNTSGHVYKMSLYDNTVSFTAATTAYTAVGEIPNGSGYTTGGFAWTAAQNTTPTAPGPTATTACWTWTVNPSWTTATFTAYGAMIYNSSSANRCVCVLDFGGAKPVSAGTFTVVLPTNDSANAILRIA